jgi:hypothetical protein
MPVQIKTGRGLYNLSAAAPAESDSDGIVLTLAMERADGIERVVLRCRIDGPSISSDDDAEALIARLQPWLEREFEQTREAALKSIRAERRLFELRFGSRNPGPFA